MMDRDKVMISAEFYKKIIEAMPILCVDIVIRDASGKFLLVRRKNEPLKNKWWVVGGRVHKGESLRQAAARKVESETCLRVKNLQVVGYYEGLFAEPQLHINGDIHTISVVFLAEVDGSQSIELDAQSSAWKFADRLPVEFDVRSIGSLDEEP